jgi:hypothetical protein
MILRAVLASLLLSAAAHAADFDRTLAVSSTPDLTVATGSGHVRITPGTDSAIHIKAHVYASGWTSGWNGSGDVEERIKRIAANPPIRQSGNTVSVGSIDSSDRELFQNITIDYDITAPRAVALTLRTGSGDIDVDNLGRAIKAESGSGSVVVHGLKGPADLHTGSGRIELQEQSSGDVHASTGSGSIHIDGLAGGLIASTGSGTIEAGGRITGPSKLITGSGSIRLHLGQDAKLNLNASTGSGSIHAPGVSSSDHHRVNQAINGGGPALDAHTGSGSIEIN